MKQGDTGEIINIVDNIAKQCKITRYSVNVKEDDFTGGNYTSKIVHVQIISEGNDTETETISLLVKIANSEEDGRGYIPINEFFKTEILAYNIILPAFYKYQQDHNVPKNNCFAFAKYYDGMHEFLKEYIAMEDLSYSGYKVYSKIKTINYEQSKTVLRILANFHAVSFAMQAHHQEKFMKLKEGVTDQNYRLDICLKLADIITNISRKLNSDQRKCAIIKFLKNSTKIVERTLNSKSTSPFNVICHGDLWNTNMMFKYFVDGTIDVKFVDFQLMRYASPATDVVFNFYLSTEKSFRDEYFPQLCEEYYNCLGETLKYYGCDVNKIYPRHVFERHLADTTEFGILFGLMSCPLALGKVGEERKFDELMDGASTIDISTTDEMIIRLENLADEIINLNS